jgi:hypothetical protein
MVSGPSGNEPFVALALGVRADSVEMRIVGMADGGSVPASSVMDPAGDLTPVTDEAS